MTNFLDSAPASLHHEHASATRRDFLRVAGSGLALSFATRTLAASGADGDQNRVRLAPVQAPTEKQERTPAPNDEPAKRVGYAIVGLGRLSLGQILPALRTCKHGRAVALVSGDRDKALKTARQYGIRESSIYDYAGFDRVADNPEIQAVYVVLPNSMHAEYTVRAAAAGKHVLCEKPMATSVADCQRMIDACTAARVKLMIAYRSQYEPMSRRLVQWVRQKRLGDLKEFVSANSQNMGDPSHWRLKRSLAGGGPLPDVGVYCINASRFVADAEPTEVFATTYSTPGDVRFREVEESVQFVLRFPNGYTATCSSSYSSHKSQFLRLQGALGWAEMDPAYGYKGIKLRLATVMDDEDRVEEPVIEAADQFEREMDHFSQCVKSDKPVRTPGEEGLQDQRIIEALYQSARDGRPVKVSMPTGRTRFDVGDADEA